MNCTGCHSWTEDPDAHGRCRGCHDYANCTYPTLGLCVLADVDRARDYVARTAARYETPGKGDGQMSKQSEAASAGLVSFQEAWSGSFDTTLTESAAPKDE